MKALMRFSAMSFPAIAMASAYRASFTPHGRMNFGAAFALKWLVFDYKIKPNSDSDIKIPVPINLLYALSMILPKERVAKTSDVSIPSGGDEIGGRLYWPATAPESGESPPLVIYYHGGGFVVGNIDQFDPLARSLANATGSVVLSVDYRLAPAFAYPTPVDDAYAALEWAAANAESLGIDADRIVVSGDSAGGNLAAVSAMRARDRNGPRVAAQLLFYPATDLSHQTYPSREKFMDGYGLSNESAEAFSEAYLGHVDADDRSHPDISPLHAECHSDLPPTLMITAGFDPLVDCGRTYAGKLRDSGVEVVEEHYPGSVHGFLGINLFPERRNALARAGQFLDRIFERG